MKNYYIGDGVKNPTRVRARITAGKCVPDIYIVTLSDNPGNILEILPAVTLALNDWSYNSRIANGIASTI